MQKNNKIEMQKINNLKTNFRNIINFRLEIKSIFENLELKISKLKEIYNEFIKNNDSNIFLFGLDSLYFQGKLIDIELDHMKIFFKLISNRMYSSYYKLYKIISVYINKTFTEKKILDIVNLDQSFPVYKDLEPYKEYDFDIICKVHDTIISSIVGLDEYINSNNLMLNQYHESQKQGLNIDNFIHTYEHKNMLVKIECELHISYMEILHKLNYNYHKRFITKIRILLSQVEHDIKFDDKNSNKNMIKNLMDDHVDEKLINQIKDSISNDIYENTSDNSLKSSSPRLKSIIKQKISLDKFYQSPNDDNNNSYNYNNVDCVINSLSRSEKYTVGKLLKTESRIDPGKLVESDTPSEPEHVEPEPVTPEHVEPEPVTPEPVTPEPVTPEHVEPEHVEPEPVEPEPVEPEPVEPEPVEPEPVESEPVESEPVESEPVESEPVEPEPVEPEPVESEPVESEPVEPEPVEPEPVESEPVESEPVEPEHFEPEPDTPEPVESIKIEERQNVESEDIHIDNVSEDKPTQIDHIPLELNDANSDISIDNLSEKSKGIIDRIKKSYQKSKSVDTKNRKSFFRF